MLTDAPSSRIMREYPQQFGVVSSSGRFPQVREFPGMKQRQEAEERIMSWNRIEDPPRKRMTREIRKIDGVERQVWGINVWLGRDEYAHDVRRYYYRTSESAARGKHSDEIGKRGRLA